MGDNHFLLLSFLTPKFATRPQLINCHFSSTSISLSEPTIPVPKEFRCPPTGKLFVRDIFDCSVYHFCDDGVDERFDCPGGFHYDVKEAKCDWPNKETCEYANETCEYLTVLEDSIMPSKKRNVTGLITKHVSIRLSWRIPLWRQRSRMRLA